MVLSHYSGELSDCNRDNLVHKAKNIHELALQRSLPAPALDYEHCEAGLIPSISVPPHLSTQWGSLNMGWMRG